MGANAKSGKRGCDLERACENRSLQVRVDKSRTVLVKVCKS